MMHVAWSEDAVNDFHANIEYLSSEWSDNSAASFIDEVEEVIEIIKVIPELFPETESYPKIRRAVIRKQITMFYKIEKDTIYILRLWNTFQDPDSLIL